MCYAEAASVVVLQGHFQIALNRERCPLLQKRLSVGMRILYMSGVWSYIVGLTSTPTFIIIPLVNAPTFVNNDACCHGLQLFKTLLQCMLQVQPRMQGLLLSFSLFLKTLHNQALQGRSEQIALVDRQDLPRRCLPHHELESVIIVTIVIVENIGWSRAGPS